MSDKITYRDAGVDIDEGNRMVDLIKPLVKSTFRPEVATDIGGFGAMFRLDVNRYKNPLLVSSTDGVGTKLKIASWANMHQSIGIDLVAMCVNDLVVQGAEPLFFLDYFACGKLKAEDAASVVSGIAEGCKQAGCALIGGETAEMPGFYLAGEYELAGFSVGIVDQENVIDGSNVSPGDVVLGMPSSGIHSNGYSLVRKIVFENLDYSPEKIIPNSGRTAAEELLRPTRIYVKQSLMMAKTGHVKAFAHITGGGFFDNIPRVLPGNMRVVIDRSSVPVLPIFDFLQEQGNIDDREMYRTFNMGIGMIAIVAKEHVAEVVEAAEQTGENLVKIGVVEDSSQPPSVIIE